MGIKLYNKLSEKIKRLHTLNNSKKRAEINTSAKPFLCCRRTFRGNILVAVCIGNWGK